ncbi:hypothetical protein [Pyrococcus kukulkanii]|uniref:Uncharacterized protein n=1 Tax=Pyrococcus kukulkanii TaxID=1609559 RepID=A0A127BBH5_9EURY|nr:hypothetical protein [Pyrococcus kukulkanii]AMM54688.1 hypothetical protein TQ32_09460 [Pyrococcus kukulkanii]
MRKFTGLKLGIELLLFIFLIFNNFNNFAEASNLFWIKEGVYFKYTARGEHAVTIGLENGTIYVGKYGVLLWRITNMSNGYITVNVSLEVYNITVVSQRILDPDEGYKKAMKIIEELNLTINSDSCKYIQNTEEDFKICKTKEAISIETIGKDYRYGLYVKDKKEAVEGFISFLPSINRSAIVRISLSDNSVIFNGKKLGMNTLFITDLRIKGKTIMDGWYINRVEILNATIHTRFRDFRPPVLLVWTNFYKNSSNLAFYDPASGILIEGYTPVSPIWLAFGFKYVLFSDREHFKKARDPITQSKDIYGFGMVLEDTNAFHFEKEELKNISIPRDAILIFLFSVLVSLVVAYEMAKGSHLGE